MKKVLIIEDNYDIRENLIEFLEMEGFEILAASNGKTGVELAVQFIPDLIICDVLMPDMDGYKVLSILLSRSETKNIPFIFSTSNSEKVDYAEAMALGATDYIVKPFAMETFLSMIRSNLTEMDKNKAMHQ